MLISDVFMENPFVNSDCIGLSNGEIVRFTSQKTIQCYKMYLLGPFSNKAVGLKMHFIGSKTRMTSINI